MSICVKIIDVRVVFAKGSGKIHWGRKTIIMTNQVFHYICFKAAEIMSRIHKKWNLSEKLLPAIPNPNARLSAANRNKKDRIDETKTSPPAFDRFNLWKLHNEKKSTKIKNLKSKVFFKKKSYLFQRMRIVDALLNNSFLTKLQSSACLTFRIQV
jgi:hypothetical protein